MRLLQKDYYHWIIYLFSYLFFIIIITGLIILFLHPLHLMTPPNDAPKVI